MPSLTESTCRVPSGRKEPPERVASKATEVIRASGDRELRDWWAEWGKDGFVEWLHEQGEDSEGAEND
jgi:hypothetical protein